MDQVLCRTNEGRKKRLMAILTIYFQMFTIIRFLLVMFSSGSTIQRYRPRTYVLNFYVKREHIRRILRSDNDSFKDMLRMDARVFFKLCEMLEALGGLRATRHMLIDEQVAMFLHILAHHVKNRVIKHKFGRSGRTVSRSFHNVLKAVLRLQGYFLKKLEPILSSSLDERWKHFENCLGALDGTYIKINVPLIDKPRYRTQKGEIATNVLGVCTPSMHFVYVLPGWERSAADSRVLRDAISTYYLIDAGYPNCEGFLAPFRGQQYHLNEWRRGYQPRTPQEFFNMKHAAARNVIERCFGLLKLRWGILRSPSFYHVRIHNRIIIACCLLHNYIRTEMAIDPMENELDEYEENSTNMDEDDPITTVQTSDAWNNWRQDLAHRMYNEWNVSHSYEIQ